MIFSGGEGLKGARIALQDVYLIKAKIVDLAPLPPCPKGVTPHVGSPFPAFKRHIQSECCPITPSRCWGEGLLTSPHPARKTSRPTSDGRRFLLCMRHRMRFYDTLRELEGLKLPSRISI